MGFCMQIADLNASDELHIQQVAALLVAGFHEHWPQAWPDLDSALETVRESFGPDCISRVALDGGAVVGWIAANSQYDGFVWELDPIVVAPALQRQGIGRALVADLETRVKALGGLTIWLGSDDEDSMTTLSGVDLYPDVWPHIEQIRNLRGHPYEFYQKLGYAIVGVMPDANGIGKPDIYMAKRVG